MSEDDELLRALGAIAREDGAREESARGRAAWERLAAGEGSVEEALAAGGDEGLSDDEARALAELLQAKGGADEAALVERVAGVLARGTGSGGHVPEVRQDAVDVGPAAAPIDLATARARRRWLGLGGGALAVAAALMLWVTSGDPAAPLALPEYGLVARNQTVQSERGEPAEDVARYRAESEIDWVLAPEEAIAADVGAVILVEGTGASKLVRPPVERSEEGALRIRGTIGERLGLAAGRYTLRFLIGPAAGLPRDAGAVEGAIAAGVVREATPRYAIEILE